MSGQALLLVMILIPILVISFFAIFDEGFASYQHLRQQKVTDSYAFNLATDQARALNAIAALNKGLVIAHNRGLLMATAVTGLTACSAFSPDCAKALQRLLPKVRPFYRKLDALGKSLAAQQDALVDWAYQTQVSALIYFHRQNSQVMFALGPRLQPTRLQLVRADTQSSAMNSLVECKSHITTSITQAQYLANAFPSNNAILRYEESLTGLQQRITLDPYNKKPITSPVYDRVGTTMKPFYFHSAVVRVCASFRSILQNINLDFIFDVPAPYVFLNTHFQTSDHLDLVARSPLDEITPSIFGKKNSYHTNQTESSAIVLGSNLMNMEFVPRLARLKGEYE